jgi:2-dehydro-3-deoxyphosphogluconate aldolase/(4S)-4-hydroxy-2-oxoglutarate aldolase
MTMTTIELATQQIKQAGVIAILRGDFTLEDMLRLGDALLSGGVTVMEVTLNSPAALPSLPLLRKHFGSNMLVGAGTVRDAGAARRAIAAGAQFLVSPNFDADSVQHSLGMDILHLPGVLTPTEVQSAFAAGCRMLKLFPCDALGPAYLKALRAPLDDVDFVPTGGVTLDNISDYARAGAAAVGLGSSLIAGPSQSAAELAARAAALKQAWEAARHGQ